MEEQQSRGVYLVSGGLLNLFNCLQIINILKGVSQEEERRLKVLKEKQEQNGNTHMRCSSFLIKKYSLKPLRNGGGEGTANSICKCELTGHIFRMV